MNVNRALLYLGCFTIGIIAGLRSLTAPALVSWAAHLGWLDLSGSWLSFLGSRAAIITLSSLALAELVADKLPKTPKRTDLGPLIFRAITGGLSSLALRWITVETGLCTHRSRSTCAIGSYANNQSK